MKICIVSPDIIGPIRNGGIGTYASTLCRLLKGHKLTVLFTSVKESAADVSWKKRYRDGGIELVCLEDLKNLDPLKKWAPGEDWFFERSRRIYEFLNARDFDLVHFQDWHANGFMSIRARRTGIGLRRTRLALTMHSPNEWSRQGMQAWPEHALADMKLNLAERYCCEHVEELMAPSQHMFDWALNEGWRLPENRKVVSYPYLPLGEPSTPAQPDPSHVIYFGRLETRKGLGIFVDGLKRYVAASPEHGLKQVSFLGKPGTHLGEPAEAVIKKLGESLNDVKFDIVSGKDSHEAVTYIAQTGGIAMIPSLLDNSPFTVIECIERGLPFFAAASGGIPELVSEESLFAPNGEGVVDALSRRQMEFSALVHPYSAKLANEHLLSQHRNWEATLAVKESSAEKPKVSICIPYYNHPAYLPQLLQSIRSLDYDNYEVIVCNDGSTLEEANRVFQELDTAYGGPAWTFLTKENGGVGDTRNFAAARATGDFIVFMDADNLARPEMLTTMMDAITLSGADCLTCYFMAFEQDEPPQSEADITYLYRPLGGGTAYSMLENTFGDANFIVRREVFEAVGGYTTLRNASFEDWEILFKLYQNKYDVDIIPQELFWYRHLETSFSRITNHFANHQRILRTALEGCPELPKELITQFSIPIYYHFLELERACGLKGGQALTRKAPWHKLVYRFYRRAIGDPKYQKRH